MNISGSVQKEQFEEANYINEDQYLNSERLSQYATQYADFFKGIQQHMPKVQAVIQKLAEQLIDYKPSAPHESNPLVSIFKRSRNSQIVILKVKWGRLQQNISVINFLHSNPYLPPQSKYKQKKKCTLYERRLNNNWIILKNQPFEPYNRSSVILAVLKQVFIAKIASALEFGPICCVDTCFDLFLYENAIQFGMEKCLGIQQKSFVKDNSLRSSLLMMHSLRIIHYDIKPENIMYSQRLRKWVTIDFNLSEITDIQQGKKRILPFRGTLNYCCPDMAQNFILTDNLNFVDPYYNDVYCMKEFLLSAQQHIVKIDYEQICTYSQEQIQKSQEQFLLLNLKKMLFSNEWVKAKKIDKQFRNLLQQTMMGKLTEFMYELQPSDCLSEFYHSCIPSCYQDTLHMREFNHLLGKKWRMGASSPSNTTEKRAEFESRLQLADVNILNRPNLLSKIQIIKYLESKDNFFNDEVMYFNIFLEFASYHCNQYRVNKSQREEAARVCQGFIKKYSGLHNQNVRFFSLDNYQLKNEVEFVLTYILNYTIKNILLLRQQQSKQIILRQTLRKLLPYVFILDLGTLQQNLAWFDQLIAAFTTAQDKLAIILYIKHLNEWNSYRIRAKKSQSRYYTYIKTGEFVCLQLIDLQEKQSSIVKAVRNNINRCSKCRKEEIFHIDSDKMPNNISDWLKELIQTQDTADFLNMSLHDSNSRQKINKILLINSGRGAEFKHYYFMLHESHRSYGQKDFCQSIYKIFRHNLSDDCLEKEYRIYYSHNFIEDFKLESLEMRFDFLEQYLGKIKREDLILNQGLIATVHSADNFLKRIGTFLSKEKYAILDEKSNYCIKKLQNLNDFYHLNKRNIINSFSLHICFQLSKFVPIYVYRLWQYKDIQQYEVFLGELKQIERYQGCRGCETGLNYLRIICLQNWIMAFMPQDAIQKFSQISKYLINDNQFFPISIKEQVSFIGFKLYTLTNFATFCVTSKENEDQYKGLRNLYHIIKQCKDDFNVSYLWIYYGVKSINKLLLLATLRNLFEQSSQQFICFLHMLGQFLENCLCEKNFNTLLFNFAQFLTSLADQEKSNLFNLIRAKAESVNNNIRFCFRIYFFVLAQFSQEPSIQRYSLSFVAKSLSLLSFDFQNQYSSQIHRHFVVKLRRQGKQFSRQQSYLNNQLVKILIKLGRKVQKNGKKYPKFKDRLTKKLIQKIVKIQGPFRITDTQQNKFWFQIKRKARKQ